MATAFTNDDRDYMAKALKLAELGLYTATPNPRVVGESGCH